MIAQHLPTFDQLRLCLGLCSLERLSTRLIFAQLFFQLLELILIRSPFVLKQKTAITLTSHHVNPTSLPRILSVSVQSWLTSLVVHQGLYASRPNSIRSQFRNVSDDPYIFFIDDITPRQLPPQQLHLILELGDLLGSFQLPGQSFNLGSVVWYLTSLSFDDPLNLAD